jgi:hypothetical protein
VEDPFDSSCRLDVDDVDEVADLDDVDDADDVDVGSSSYLVVVAVVDYVVTSCQRVDVVVAYYFDCVVASYHLVAVVTYVVKSYLEDHLVH